MHSPENGKGGESTNAERAAGPVYLASELKELVNPSAGPRGKYSPKLCRWLRTCGFTVKTDVRVYKNAHGHLLIGGMRDDTGFINASKIMAILTGNSQIWAWMPGDNWSWTDISESFWPNYIARGRCALFDHNTNWLIDSEFRYEQIDESHRRCNWCGAELTRSIVQKVRHVKVWNETSAAPSADVGNLVTKDGE